MIHEIPAKIAQPDTPHLALLHHPLHLSPRVLQINVLMQVIAALILWEQIVGGNKLEVHGPVDQVQVEVVSLEILQRLVQSGLDVLGPVAVVPELGGQEDLAAWDTRFLNPGTDFGLVLVDSRAVDVSVPGAEGDFDGLFDFIWFRLLVIPQFAQPESFPSPREGR
jgi:hypothetical protein